MNKLKDREEPTGNPASQGNRPSPSQLALLFLLGAIAALGTLPGYLKKGQWSWSDLPLIPASTINQVRSLRDGGLALPGWRSVQQASLKLGENYWSVQIMEKEGQPPVTLFLLPQAYYRAHPQVEWVDLQGLERWKMDSRQTLTFAAGGAGRQVTANFFRAWREQTFAVVQWYAWPAGGNAAPARWFWADQQAQLSGNRVPWIAVSLKIPIDPLSNFNDSRPLAKSLAQEVQETLQGQIFNQSPPERP